MPAIRAATLEGDYPEYMTLRDRHAFRMGALTALLAIDEPIEPVAGIFRVAFENELEWRLAPTRRQPDSLAASVALPARARGRGR
jgi:hypothetical protein